MNTPAWTDLETLFHDALARSASDRAAFLAERCAGRPALRAQIEAMLRVHDEGASALNVSSMATRAALKAGARLGAHQILGALGAGGMGEVYRARDTRLGRDVAIKVLPSAFVADADRLARFEREARMLAALNHPNIATIHGLEDADGTRALVMELVEGETLAERLSRGARVVGGALSDSPRGPDTVSATGLPVDEALGIARQIAEALEAAHEKGIIHRDLKPANIKITPAGAVKVLDFGLAKVASADGAESQAPAATIGGTRDGMILGTAAYMSPEQARGKPVDKRTDIWAFGCVLYEMLTGCTAFAGDTLSDTIAAILQREPDWSAVPGGTPPHVQRLVERCLEKDVKHRLRDIGDASLELRGPPATGGSEGARPSVASTNWSRILLYVAAAAALAVTIVWVVRQPAAVTAPAVSRVAMALPPALPFVSSISGDIAISPDGTRLAYMSAQGLAVRMRDRLDAALLPVGGEPRFPFFSPDGQWIGYTDGNSLKKVSVGGGPPVTIATTGPSAAGSWSAEGIVFADTGGLFRVAPEGGAPEKLRMELESSEQAAFPEPLPGGGTVLLTVIPSRTSNVTLDSIANAAGARIDAVDLRTGARKTLIRGGAAARYVPTGHLVYAAGGMLHAVAFDDETVEVSGDPVQVASETGSYEFAVSSEGTLVYVWGSDRTTDRTLVWVDRRGGMESLDAPARPYVYPRLSPDGTRVALVVRTSDADRDIWIWDLQRKVLESFTLDPADNPTVAWSPDGRRLAFGSSRVGGVANVYWQAADGSGAPERLLESAQVQLPMLFTRDGRLLLSADEPGESRNILALSLDGTRRTERIVHGAATDLSADVSPDGRWIAYDSNESGQFEIYVRPYPDADRGRWVISTGGGRQSVWSRDGRELFYRDFTGALMALPVTLSPTFVAGPVVKLIDGSGYAGGGSAGSARTYEVSQDGRRFLMIKEGAGAGGPAPSLVLVQNWDQELKRLVPTR